MKNYLLFTFLGLVVLGSIGYQIYQDTKTAQAQLIIGVGYFQAATSGVMAITSDTRILATTSNRAYASICNDSSQVVYLGLDQDKPLTADGLNKGHRLNALGGCLEITAQEGIYWGSIRASSTNETSSNLIIREYKQR